MVRGMGQPSSLPVSVHWSVCLSPAPSFSGVAALITALLYSLVVCMSSLCVPFSSLEAFVVVGV